MIESWLKTRLIKHIMVSTQSTVLVVVQLTLNLSEQQRMIVMQRLHQVILLSSVMVLLTKELVGFI